MTDAYVTDEAHGDNWSLYLADSCEELSKMDDDSVHLSVCSPPFDDLYTYSPTERDLGNNPSRQLFLEHYSYVIREQLRVTLPGRMACVHVSQVPVKKSVAGYVGLTDFRGDVIRAFQAAGWIYYGETTVWKDPQAQSIRLKVHALAFATKNRDSAASRPALADYLLLFRKPGDNPVRILHETQRGEVTNDDWIEWASPIWTDTLDGGWIDGDHLCPVWFGIKESNTLNVRAARNDADERHICPLQLDFIDRCVRLWSNPGETVLSPFAGLGSEIYVAVKRGRCGIGFELKPDYWRSAVNNLRQLEADLSAPTLFDEEAS